MTDHEGRMEWRGHETWYRVVGELDPAAPQTPAVICHGGPGAAHDYCEPIADLSRSSRTCILYDQLGCGKSQLLPDAPADFWTPQLFKDELAELVRHLGIADRYVIVGQSWGGMLAMDYALDHPAGLRGIVVADSPANMTLWVSEANRLRAGLPPEVQETLTRHEEAGTTDDPEYEAAVAVFYDRHVCRVVPLPDCVARTFAQIAANPTVRIPRGRVAENLGHHRAAARDNHANPPRLRPLRRGDPAHCRADPRAHPGGGVGDLRELEPHAARRRG
jgi:L-proline amide hydrolase